MSSFFSMSSSIRKKEGNDKRSFEGGGAKEGEGAQPSML